MHFYFRIKMGIFLQYRVNRNYSWRLPIFVSLQHAAGNQRGVGAKEEFYIIDNKFGINLHGSLSYVLNDIDRVEVMY